MFGNSDLFHETLHLVHPPYFLTIEEEEVRLQPIYQKMLPF